MAFVDADKLLSFKRLDVFFKIYYVLNRKKYPRLSSFIYRRHIEVITSGTNIEPGSSTKFSLDDFQNEFDSLINNIKKNGFVSQFGKVPVDSAYVPINGAHRVSVCNVYDRVVDVEVLDTEADSYDYSFFLDRGMERKYIEEVLLFNMPLISDYKMMLVWPSARSFLPEIMDELPDVLYRRTLDLSPKGAHSMIVHAYSSEAWIGSFRNSFEGAFGKLVHCFPQGYGKLEVILFKSVSEVDTLNLKKKLRNQIGLGKHALHTTDNYSELLRLASLALSEDGRLLLNSGFALSESLCLADIDSNSVGSEFPMIDCMSASKTLSLFGIESYVTKEQFREPKKPPFRFFSKTFFSLSDPAVRSIVPENDLDKYLEILSLSTPESINLKQIYRLYLIKFRYLTVRLLRGLGVFDSIRSFYLYFKK